MSQFRYKAFVSYTHADEKWAKWLHKQLESYRVPKYLVARDGLESNRLKPIFRDRDELSSHSSLNQAIQDAIAASENLIVICSPASAASKWVNEEIQTFKQLGRSERIHCLIVDGDPSTAFPPAFLEDDEPLAADIIRDGKQMSFLKIAAGILQVPFDDLRQREQQARNRRLAIVASFSFAGMVFAVGLATFAMISRQQAIEAREEANRQRQVAEAAEQVAVREAETSSRVSNFLVGLFQVSDPSEARGNTITAREILDKGAEDIQVELATEPEIRATLNQTIGSVYHSLGLYESSREQLSLALETREELLGDINPEVATSLISMAQLERDAGNLANARELYERALDIRESVLDPEDPAVAEALNELASLVWETGDLDGSLQLYQRALAIREANLGPDHPDLAATLRGMAAVSWSRGDFLQASESFGRVLQIFRASLGEDHPDVARAMSNLAATYFMQGRFDDALPLNEEVVAINERVLGPDHPDNILALSNLSEVLVELEDYDRARTYYERAITIGENTVGPDYIELGWPLDGLGTLFHRMGDYENARAYFDRALKLREQTYGENHFDVADTLEGYAAMLRSAGEVSEAEEYEQRAQSIRQQLASGAP